LTAYEEENAHREQTALKAEMKYGREKKDFSALIE